jgi:hypothetical protein
LTQSQIKEGRPQGRLSPTKNHQTEPTADKGNPPPRGTAHASRIIGFIWIWEIFQLAFFRLLRAFFEFAVLVFLNYF